MQSRKPEILISLGSELTKNYAEAVEAFGGIAPPPLPVTKELVAEIVSRAYDEN